MENLYNRVENLDELIRSVKLPYLAWKVLFIVNKDIMSDQIAEMAEAEQSEVDDALQILVKKGLILVAQPAEEPVEESMEQEPLAIPDDKNDEDAEESEETDENFSEFLSEVEEPQNNDTSSVEAVDETPPVVEEEITEPGPSVEEDAETEESIDVQVDKQPEPLSDVTDSDEKIIIDIPEDDDVTAHTDADDDISDTLEIDLNMMGGEEPKTAPQPPAPEKEIDKSGFKTILVIDDSLVIRKMVEIALEDEDFEIKTAVSGKEGLDMMDEVNPDLVILDMMLPDINGMEILKTIKASRGIPVVMLSGKDSPQLIETAKKEGAEDFLPKPFKDDDLVQKVKNLI